MSEQSIKKVTNCQGNIYLPKRLIKQGISDECHNLAFTICKDCGKAYCYNHIKKHKCQN